MKITRGTNLVADIHSYDLASFHVLLVAHISSTEQLSRFMIAERENSDELLTCIWISKKTSLSTPTSTANRCDKYFALLRLLSIILFRR